MRNKQKGFSLIELLIVVAIILIIAAIAIPNLLRSKMAANEASAVGSLRTMVTADVTYNSTYGNQFSSDLPSLGGPPGPNATCNAALLIDNTLATAIAAATPKSGYWFNYLPGTAITNPPAGCTNPGVLAFAIQANPAVYGQTGNRYFCVDQTGVIRFDALAIVAATGNGGCTGGQPLQ